jgi:hypothetical protein
MEAEEDKEDKEKVAEDAVVVVAVVVAVAAAMMIVVVAFADESKRSTRHTCSADSWPPSSCRLREQEIRSTSEKICRHKKRNLH